MRQAKGDVLDDPELMQALTDLLSDQGRHGDTMLAHITPEEAMMLEKMGGSGTINPKTGLPEFFYNTGSTQRGGGSKLETASDFGFTSKQGWGGNNNDNNRESRTFTKQQPAFGGYGKYTDIVNSIDRGLFSTNAGNKPSGGFFMDDDFTLNNNVYTGDYFGSSDLTNPGAIGNINDRSDTPFQGLEGLDGLDSSDDDWSWGDLGGLAGGALGALSGLGFGVPGAVLGAAKGWQDGSMLGGAVDLGTGLYNAPVWGGPSQEAADWWSEQTGLYGDVTFDAPGVIGPDDQNKTGTFRSLPYFGTDLNRNDLSATTGRNLGDLNQTGLPDDIAMALAEQQGNAGLSAFNVATDTPDVIRIGDDGLARIEVDTRLPWVQDAIDTAMRGLETRVGDPRLRAELGQQLEQRALDLAAKIERGMGRLDNSRAEYENRRVQEQRALLAEQEGLAGRARSLEQWMNDVQQGLDDRVSSYNDEAGDRVGSYNDLLANLNAAQQGDVTALEELVDSENTQFQELVSPYRDQLQPLIADYNPLYEEFGDNVTTFQKLIDAYNQRKGGRFKDIIRKGGDDYFSRYADTNNLKSSRDKHLDILEAGDAYLDEPVAQMTALMEQIQPLLDQYDSEVPGAREAAEAAIQDKLTEVQTQQSARQTQVDSGLADLNSWLDTERGAIEQAFADASTERDNRSASLTEDAGAYEARLAEVMQQLEALRDPIVTQTQDALAGFEGDARSLIDFRNDLLANVNVSQDQQNLRALFEQLMPSVDSRGRRLYQPGAFNLGFGGLF